MSGSLQSVHVAGGLLPADVLSAVLAGTLDGLSGNDYHLGGESPREAAARVWTHLLGVYRRFRGDLDRLPEGDPAVGATRERWLGVLMAELGYGRVPATVAGGIAAGDRQYPVSHLWGETPIHLLGWNVSLEKRTPGVPGAAQRAPHAMVQELLNRSDRHLWAILSNGRLLRLLRDSATLTGQAYVEFDLEAMFDGELFGEFALLYLLVHESRVEVPPGGLPADCWLERWRTTAVAQGVRALTLLRAGVQEALETLGTGFLRHPANAALRDGLRNGAFRLEDLHRALLRVVYRLLFWSVAEDRDALHPKEADPAARERYATHFSSRRLRDLAVRRHGSAHDDLWRAVTLVMDALGRMEGEPRLGLVGLGGLFTTTATDVVSGARLGNQPLLAAVRSLSVVQPKGQPRRHVDFRNLGAEELGSVYESLLELVPRCDDTTWTFTLEALAGNDRKTSGSYYTPTDLVDLVLDTALDPVLDAAEREPDPEQALLALTVCDPAIGSGHFMVAAARRIATRLAAVRTGEVDPTPTTVQDAMHDVVARCVYGVDVNPMAAELAKVSLWLEAMTPDRPLSFLDHHIKVGNALLGTTPALLHAGIPAWAYKPVIGDDRNTAALWRKLNESQRGGQSSLFGDAGLGVGNAVSRRVAEEIDDRAGSERSLADVTWAAQRYATAMASDDVVRARRLADAWCVAFLGPKTPEAVPITHAVLRQIEDGSADLDPAVLDEVDRLATRHRLFHWHLEFPDVFAVPDDGPANTPTGWTGGFSAVLGNPPWERVKIQEKEFFESRDAEIAGAKNAAARKKAIAALAESNPDLLAEFQAAKHASEAESQFLRLSGRYPLCGVGDVNTYAVFAEHFRTVTSSRGRSGVIAPTGLVTDFTTAPYFASAIREHVCAAVLDFVTNPEIWGEIGHGRQRFSVLVCTGGDPVDRMLVMFNAKHPRELAVPGRAMTLTPEQIARVNPNTGTCPLFEDPADARITLHVYERFPIIIADGPPARNPWGLRFGTMFHMANDSGLFRTFDDLSHDGATFEGWAWKDEETSYLPLYEGKLLHIWNHRFSTYANLPPGYEGTALPRLSPEILDDPTAEPRARYWVPASTVGKQTPTGWNRDWYLGFRDIARATDVRTFVASVLPRTAVGHVFPLAMLSDPTMAPLLQAMWSSFAFDYLARQKLSGTHLTYSQVKQLVCPEPDKFKEQPAWCGTALETFVRPRVLELTYTSFRIKHYAADVVGGDPGAPFRWMPKRREQLAAELDAAMLHLYGLDREDAEHVLDSFSLLRRYEEEGHGTFRTKWLVLDAYDAMTEAAALNTYFQSPLDPPPGEGPRHEGSTS